VTATWHRRSLLEGIRKDWDLVPSRYTGARCYRRKTDALNALRVENQAVIDTYLIDAGSEDWDAVEVKYGGPVRDVFTAMAKSLPVQGRPYCVTDFDLDTFRNTTAMLLAEEDGAAFTLPDSAYDYLGERGAEQAAIDEGTIDECWTVKSKRRRLRGKYMRPKEQRRCICRADTGRFEKCSDRLPDATNYQADDYMDDVPF